MSRWLKRRVGSLAAGIWIFLLCVSCGNPEREIAWELAEERGPASDLSGVDIYTEEQVLPDGNRSISICIVNGSEGDIAVRKIEDEDIQKMVDGRWSIAVSENEGRRGTELEYTVLGRGNSMIVTYDRSPYGDNWTPGEYRAEICMYRMGEERKLEDGFYTYCEFAVTDGD